MTAATLVIASLVVTAGAVSCTNADQANSQQPPQVADAAPLPPQAAPTPISAEDEQFYRDMARDAWRYMEQNYSPATGFVKATPDWAFTTIWDVGGQILAFHAAKELDLLEDAEYHTRTQRLLTTLETMPMFRDAAFNKLYSTEDASMGGATGAGTGWSATDLGRLLVALKVLSEREPQYAERAAAIVGRLDMDQIVDDGYVHGQMIGSTTGEPWTFQEGRIGYEQYVAHGFDAWGADVDNALNVNTNAEPIEVLGVPLLGDRRSLDRLLSEPLILLGLELGLPQDMRELAGNMLRVQEARFRETGQVTMVSEDAVAVEPTYFYYYCIYCNGKPFVVDISSPGNERDEPRWVSTKAAFGWHALMPNDYTSTAIEHVAPAHDDSRGWASGVFEGTAASTATFDINTSAVLLEIAYYQLRGKRPHIHGD